MPCLYYLFLLCALLISDAAICNIFAKPRFNLSVLLPVVLWRESMDRTCLTFTEPVKDHSLNLLKREKTKKTISQGEYF